METQNRYEGYSCVLFLGLWVQHKSSLIILYNGVHQWSSLLLNLAIGFSAFNNLLMHPRNSWIMWKGNVFGMFVTMLWEICLLLNKSLSKSSYLKNSYSISACLLHLKWKVTRKKKDDSFLEPKTDRKKKMLKRKKKKIERNCQARKLWKNNLNPMVGQNDVCLDMQPSVRTLIQEHSLISKSRQLGHHSSVRVFSFSYQQHVAGVATGCCGEPVPIPVLHMEPPQLLSHMALTRQWLHCHSESCHKCQTEASGYLLPVPERPDLESEKHIMNQTIEIGINYFICSFTRKYTENNFLFHLSNLRKLLMDCYFHFILWLFLTNEISNST